MHCCLPHVRLCIAGFEYQLLPSDTSYPSLRLAAECRYWLVLSFLSRAVPISSSSLSCPVLSLSTQRCSSTTTHQPVLLSSQPELQASQPCPSARPNQHPPNPFSQNHINTTSSIKPIALPPPPPPHHPQTPHRPLPPHLHHRPHPQRPQRRRLLHNSHIRILIACINQPRSSPHTQRREERLGGHVRGARM